MALHAKAKAEAGYRVSALYDKISREDILAHAYAQCRSNKGAPGGDGQDFAEIEAYGVEGWLGELALALRQETYRPDPIIGGRCDRIVHLQGNLGEDFAREQSIRLQLPQLCHQHMLGNARHASLQLSEAMRSLAQRQVMFGGDCHQPLQTSDRGCTALADGPASHDGGRHRHSCPEPHT
jgi:hypothetical protein